MRSKGRWMSRPSDPSVPRPNLEWLNPRTRVALGCFAAAAISAIVLELSGSDLFPSEGGLALGAKFFSRALTPAIHSEAALVPEGAPPLLIVAFSAALMTLRLAAAATGAALLLSVPLTFLASTSWWPSSGARVSSDRSVLGRVGYPAMYAAARVAITGMRSVHEVLWAVLFLAAFGMTEVAAVIAIAIPYSGTLAKVFSELIDETPRDASSALKEVGASSMQVYCFALLPRALPDMIAYAFYRFECALRSAAVLGFFGFATLGLEIRQSFSSSNYGEVWTFLYVLILMIVAFEAWSGAIRRRLVG